MGSKDQDDLEFWSQKRIPSTSSQLAAPWRGRWSTEVFTLYGRRRAGRMLCWWPQTAPPVSNGLKTIRLTAIEREVCISLAGLEVEDSTKGNNPRCVQQTWFVGALLISKVQGRDKSVFSETSLYHLGECANNFLCFWRKQQMEQPEPPSCDMCTAHKDLSSSPWGRGKPMDSPMTCALPTKSSPVVSGGRAEENQWILLLSISLSVTRLWKTQGSHVGISQEERLSSHPVESLALMIPWHARISRADLTLTWQFHVNCNHF